MADEKKYSKIIVAGHSEGSLIGMIACHQSGKAAAFISLCGAGRPADELIVDQMKRQPKSLQESMASMFREWKQGKTVEDVPPELMAIARPSLQPYMMSWIKYDPCVEAKKLTIPVMIVQGTTDIQVSLVDADNLAEANPKAKKTIINNMDHLLKNNPTTNTIFQMLNDTNPKSPLHEELLPSILEFISGSIP